MTGCVVAAALVYSVAALLPPPESSYNILMLIPYWGISHKIVFMPLAEGLADRGHKVRPVLVMMDPS